MLTTEAGGCREMAPGDKTTLRHFGKEAGVGGAWLGSGAWPGGGVAGTRSRLRGRARGRGRGPIRARAPGPGQT